MLVQLVQDGDWLKPEHVDGIRIEPVYFMETSKKIASVLYKVVATINSEDSEIINSLNREKAIKLRDELAGIVNTALYQEGRKL